MIENKQPYIFIVDDLLENLQVLGNNLIDEGFEVSMANNGREALDILKTEELPDLILLDIMMPKMNGFEVCEELKKDDRTKNIPVIFLTAKTETEDIVEGLTIGGVDYITKPFQKEELMARIHTHLELKFSREVILKKSKELDKAYAKLEEDLLVASQHVRSLFPEGLRTKGLNADWHFVPSGQLSGDTFGYHNIDENHLAIYLIDVSGHGIGPALHSVSVLNTIKFQTLPDVDFKNPDQVLTALNNVYDISRNNFLFFTIWYGVINQKTNKLVYASGGHHPAILFNSGEKIELSTANPLIGGIRGHKFKSDNIELSENFSLYIFSDGAFEVEISDNKLWGIDELKKWLEDYNAQNENNLKSLYDLLIKIGGKENLDDDFTILKIWS